MEPKNRPYVDPATEPGDAGTEPWADDEDNDKDADPTTTRSTTDQVAAPEDGGAVKGSPADQFLTEDAVSALNEDPNQPANH